MPNKRIFFSKFIIICCLFCMTIRPSHGESVDGCLDYYTFQACVNPKKLGHGNEVCYEWATFGTCNRCDSCYTKVPFGEAINNETGENYDTYACNPIPFEDVGTIATQRLHEYRQCSEGIEFECKSYYNGQKVYQTSTPTCTTTVENGTLTFGHCTGCSICDEDSDNWRNVSGKTGYQQNYKRKHSPTSCTLTAIDEYRCAAGYYGNPVVNGTSFSGCKQCPTVESTGIKIVENPYNYTTVSSAPGSTDITDCFARNCGSDCLVIMNDGTGNFYWDWNVDTAGEGICYYGN